VQSRAMVQTWELPGSGPVKMVASPMKLSATPVRNDVAPPLLGQHTDEVLGELLGYSDGKIQQLRQASII